MEQFKKRQREDAARVQTELATGSAKRDNVPFGGDMRAEAAGDDEADDEMEEQEDDWIEEYTKEMSPAPQEISKMIIEERRLPIVYEDDEWRAIVSSVIHMLG